MTEPIPCKCGSRHIVTWTMPAIGGGKLHGCSCEGCNDEDVTSYISQKQAIMKWNMKGGEE